MSDFLETFAASIEKNKNYEIFYAQFRRNESQEVIGNDFDFEELVLFNYIDIGVFVHSKKVYDSLGGFDNDKKGLEDWDLIIKFTEQYLSFLYEKYCYIILIIITAQGFQQI